MTLDFTSQNSRANIVDKLKAHFRQKPLARLEIARLFKAAEWNSSDALIEGAISFKPHPSLETIWVTLNLEEINIGMANLYLPPPSSLLNPPAFIANFLITKEYQRKGLGATLLQSIEEFVRKSGVNLLALECEKSSSGFWVLMGFSLRDANSQIMFKEI